MKNTLKTRGAENLSQEALRELHRRLHSAHKALEAVEEWYNQNAGYCDTVEDHLGAAVFKILTAYELYLEEKMD